MMEKLDLILAAIEEKICEKVDVLIKRNFTCCKSCGDIKIMRESGYYEFNAYMFYPINQSREWEKQMKDPELDYVEVNWHCGLINEEYDFTKLSKIICDIVNSISKNVNMSGEKLSEPLVMKINKSLFM